MGVLEEILAEIKEIHERREHEESYPYLQKD
jgi:hypothetical protein